jgi:hypothetical protein
MGAGGAAPDGTDHRPLGGCEALRPHQRHLHVRQASVDAWHPVHRHDVAVCELAIGGSSSTVAVATRHEEQHAAWYDLTAPSRRTRTCRPLTVGRRRAAQTQGTERTSVCAAIAAAAFCAQRIGGSAKRRSVPADGAPRGSRCRCGRLRPATNDRPPQTRGGSVWPFSPARRRAARRVRRSGLRVRGRSRGSPQSKPSSARNRTVSSSIAARPR